METLRVSLVPVNFYDRNPALDVPPAEQVFNNSVLLSGSTTHLQPREEAVVEADGAVKVATT